VATVFGGTSINKNRQDVSRGVDVLVATPGRLIDLVEQRFLDLRQVEILVLDEADQMLDLGFIHDLKRIVKMLPAKRQSLFFSATMPKTIRDLADKFLTDPAEVSVAPAATTVERSTNMSPSCSRRRSRRF
jgi:ATP-dependent RNA helicase RhlE